LGQFRTLFLDSPGVSQANHDFFGGDAPLWTDIIGDLDARLEVTDHAYDLVIRSISDGLQSAICINGMPGSGKSTSLLRVAKLLLRSGYSVYMFRAEEYLNIDAAIWWTRKRPDSIFIFDDAGDFSNDIGKLLSAADEQGLACTVLCAERRSRMRSVRLGIESDYLHPPRETHLELLSDRDIGAVITKLAQHRRLGRLTNSNKSEKYNFFRKTSERQLLVAMAELEGSRTFRTRIASEYSSADLGDSNNIYATVCMAHALGIPAPLGILRSATGLNLREIQAVIETYLAGNIIEKEGRAHARHRVIASITVEDALDPATRFTVSLSLTKALSPHVTREAISAGTLYYRLARNLMRAETVRDWIGQEAAGRWYEALQHHYQWNSRFWEQRARSELFSNRFLAARSYAEEALKIHRHHFCSNTLGYVLIRMASEYYNAGDSEAARVFWEAIEHLRNSRDSSFRDTEHPYYTFFYYTLKYAKERATVPDTAFFDRMETEWSQWSVKAKMLGIFTADDDIRQFEGFKAEWNELIDRVRREPA
jgi:hypothetical protein